MSEKEMHIKHYYYVDEAGDTTLFNKRGVIIIGSPGVSKYFMLGVAHIPNPADIDKKLELLRQELLADPYFAGVPSMQSPNKTAKFFHACNDLPEIRREVFKLLLKSETKIQIVIRHKTKIAEEAKREFEESGIKITANDIYDDLIKRLFRNLLHKADENHIVVARRGKTDRLHALTDSIEKAKKNFEKKWNITNNNLTQIYPANPHEYTGLQVIDYYLWAVQRMYEKGEDRFFNMLTPHYRLIMDIDDTRNKRYGEWYSDKNPLKLQKISPWQARHKK